MYGEETIQSVQHCIIRALLNYNRYSEKPEIWPEKADHADFEIGGGASPRERAGIRITDKDADGWVLLKELREIEIEKGVFLSSYLSDKKAYLFLDMPFIEGRHKKCKAKGLIIEETTVTPSFEYDASRKYSKKTKKKFVSAYRLRRTTAAWKSLFKYLIEQEDNQLLSLFSYSEYTQSLIQYGEIEEFYARFYAVFGFSERKPLAPDDTGFGRKLASANPYVFYRFLKNPGELKTDLALIRKEYATLGLPYSYAFVAAAFTFHAALVYDARSYPSGYLQEQPFSMEYMLAPYPNLKRSKKGKKTTATKPSRQNADARVLLALDRLPFLTPRVVGITGRNFYLNLFLHSRRENHENDTT